MSEQTATAETQEAEAPKLDEYDQIIEDACEEFGSAQEALAAYNEARAAEAAKLGVHFNQVPEDRREFVIRRKLEIRAAQEKKAEADTVAVEARRAGRRAELEKLDVQARRNKAADTESRVAAATAAQREAKRVSELRAALDDPDTGRQIPRPDNPESEAEHTERVLNEAADSDAEHAAQVEADRKQYDQDHARERQAQIDADTSEPNVVTDKMALPENLDALNVGALKALAKAHGLTVERSDGKPGAPRKSDYVAALSAG